MRSLAITLVLIVAALKSSCAPADPAPSGQSAPALAARDSVVLVDLSRFFPEMEATFVVLDAARRIRYVHDSSRAAERFLPASTFKIPNTLIALETGIATDPDFALPWDSAAAPPAAYWPASWKRAQTLRSAFRNSVYWYYQELARRTGEPRMREWLGRLSYGNQDMSGGIDSFWLHGGLRISPNEQVEFLRRFLDGELPVSERSASMVRDFMLLSDSAGLRLSGKTGTADLTPTRELGWIVGWVERDGTRRIYALNMEGERVWEDWPPRKRSALVRQLFAEIDRVSR